MDTATILSRHRTARTVLFWGCVAFIALLVFSTHLLSSDEGTVLNAAWQLWHGKHLYVDFVEFITPGAPYVVFFTWKLLGAASYVGAKLVSILFFVLAAVGLYQCTKHVVRRPEHALFAALVLIPLSAVAANHNIYSAFVAVWFLDALLRAIDRPRVPQALTVGFWSGLTFLFLQTKGLALLAVAIVLLLVFGSADVRSRFSRAGSAVLGFLIPVAPLFLAWGWRTLIDAWFLLPMRGAYLAHTLVQPAVLAAEVLLVALMVLAAVRWRDRRLWALAAVQAALFLSSLNLVDIYHLLFNAFPCVVFSAAVLSRARGRWPFHLPAHPGRHPEYVALLPAAVALLTFFRPSPLVAPFYSSIYYVDLMGHGLGGIFNDPRVEAAPSIYAGPFLPGFYFELRKPNPFPVSNLMLCDGACQSRMIGVFQQAAPEFAFLGYAITDVFGYDHNNPLDTYIRMHYRSCGSTSPGSGVVYYAKSACL